MVIKTYVGAIGISLLMSGGVGASEQTTLVEQRAVVAARAGTDGELEFPRVSRNQDRPLAVKVDRDCSGCNYDMTCDSSGCVQSIVPNICRVFSCATGDCTDTQDCPR